LLIDSRSRIKGQLAPFFMPYDKDGKYYRKPVFNENFKTEKKKPLKKEPKQIKFKKNLSF